MDIYYQGLHQHSSTQKSTRALPSEGQSGPPLEELWPGHEIEVIDWADYRFRITIEKEVVFPVMMQLLESIDYSNFKHECHGMKEYQSTLMGVWTEMHAYQARMETD